MRLMPGLEELIIVRAPAPAAPKTMLIAAISLSAWSTTVPGCSRECSARYSSTSDCGVIG